MDKIILSSNDIITLLKWRDQNKDLVRRNAAPFKGIMLEFPDTHIHIKVYTDGGKLSFYLYIGGKKVWVNPYNKGTGSKTNKTYKLN